jgi:uncharacterized membrane protein (DUF106 family)
MMRNDMSSVVWACFFILLLIIDPQTDPLLDPQGVFWMFLIIAVIIGFIFLVALVWDELEEAKWQREARREHELEEARWQEEVRELLERTQP